MRMPLQTHPIITFTVPLAAAPPLAGCKRGASGKLFAMKVMNKRRIKIRQSEDLCWNERRILEALGSPFVVSYARLDTGFVSIKLAIAFRIVNCLSARNRCGVFSRCLVFGHLVLTCRNVCPLSINGCLCSGGRCRAS